MCEGQQVETEDACIDLAADALSKSCEQIIQKLRSTKDPNLAKGILKFSKRVAALSTSSTMHSNLVTAVFNFGSDEIIKKVKGKKIKVQPNRKGSLVMVVVRLLLKDVLHKCIHCKSRKRKQNTVMVWQKL